MILATQPTASLTPRMERVLADRWRDWEGASELWVRGNSLGPTIEGVRCAHREWLLSLLQRGIPLRAIRRLALDDPREPRLVLMAKAEYYQEKSRRRKR